MDNAVLFIFLISLSLSKKEKLRQNHNSAKNKKYIDLGGSNGKELNSEGTLRRKFGAFAASQAKTINFVSSPVSALLPLGKLALGAEGKCLNQLRLAIGEPTDENLKKSFKNLVKDLQYIPGVMLCIASRIYVSDTVELDKNFVKAAKNVFNSAIQKISFDNPSKAVREINNWVSKETHGTINELFSPNQISRSESLVLVNAIHFMGKWKKPFKKITLDVFNTISNAKMITKFMMQQGNYKYGTHSVLNSQLVEIPYQGDKASFIIILPSQKSSLHTLLLQLKLAPNLLSEALRNMTTKEVNLKIPKFQVTGTIDLLNIFKELGLTSISGTDSCLSKIVKDTKVWVTNAIQKAYLEIHETGTDASVASGSSLTPIKKILDIVTFTADRPFMFLLLSKGEQLFSGTYYEP